MKNPHIILVLLSLLQATSCATENDTSADSWSKFIDESDPINEGTLLLDLSRKVSECGWGKSENALVAPEPIRQELFSQIRSGSDSSLRVGFFIEKCLDGGDLGDFRRSAGQYFDAKPKEFLQEISASNVSIESFKSALTMLPLTLVDNLDGQIELVRSRMFKLGAIQERRFADLSSIGLQALEEQETFLID